MRVQSVTMAAGLLALSGCTDSDKGKGETAAVMLSVFAQGAPAADVDVYTHDRRGRLIEVSVTGSSGSLALEIPVGGMATASYVDGIGNRNVRTIAGVQDGDELSISFGSSASVANTPLIVLDSALDGAVDYFVDAGASANYFPDGALSLSLPIRTFSVNEAGTYDLLATAIGDDFNALAWSVLEDVPISTTTAFMPSWSTSFASKPVSIVNAPSAGHFSVQGDLVEEGGDFDFHGSDAVDLENGAADVALVMPSNFGTALESVYLVYELGPDATRISIRSERNGSIASAVSLDFTADFYPYIQFSDFDAQVPEVMFSGTPTDADLVGLSANWDEGDHHVFWDILLPPDATERVRAPELPDGPENPTGSPYYLSLYFFDYSYIDSYDDLRNGNVVAPQEYWLRGTIIQP